MAAVADLDSARLELAATRGELAALRREINATREQVDSLGAPAGDCLPLRVALLGTAQEPPPGPGKP